MGREAIEKIKSAEDGINRLLAEEEMKSRNLIKTAEEIGDEKYRKIINSAKEERNRMLEMSKEEAIAEMKDFHQEEKEKINKIRNMKAEELEEVVNFVYERIVKNNGNP